MSTNKKVVAIFIALVGILALAGGSLAFAQVTEMDGQRATFGRGQQHMRASLDGPHSQGMGLMDHEVMQEAVADALGLSVEQLEAAKAEGKTMVELAAEQGVDLADVHEALQGVRAELIQQAVEDGTITQEQADRLLSRPLRLGGPGGHHRGHQGGQGCDHNGSYNGLPEEQEPALDVPAGDNA